MITVSGVALVVFVFAAVLMMAYGIQSTLIATGSVDNVKIVRKAANGEISPSMFITSPIFKSYLFAISIPITQLFRSFLNVVNLL